MLCLEFSINSILFATPTNDPFVNVVIASYWLKNGEFGFKKSNSPVKKSYFNMPLFLTPKTMILLLKSTQVNSESIGI